MKNTLYNVEGLSKNDFIIPMAKYAGEFKLMMHSFKLLTGLNPNVNNRHNGFEGQNRPWNNDLEAAKKMYPAKLTYKLDKQVIGLFEEYIQYCKKQNIKLILVYTPEYIEGQKLIKNRKEIISLYEKLANKHQVPFLNYSSSKLSLNRDLFYNALHMNIHGARSFTLALSKDIKDLNNERISNNSSFTYNMLRSF